MTATAIEDEIQAQIEAFLAARLGPDARAEGVRRVGVGRSRENWLFDAVWPGPQSVQREALIVRRDPLGGLLETDRGDEFAVLKGLETTAVPAPRVRWLDATGRELGRPSLVMVRERGECDYFVVNGERPLPDRLALARQFCELLATVHGVDWQALGMDEFLADPGPGAALAEVTAWETILRRDQVEPYPEMDLAAHWLRAHAPLSPKTVLIHGDFKAGNVLLEDGAIVALLDWELAHLGDPHEDLGWITQPLRTREHLIPQAWERDDLLDYYQQLTGLEVDNEAVTWWNVLACYKTGVMQASGLRSYVEGRADELYQPSADVLRTLLELTEA